MEYLDMNMNESRFKMNDRPDGSSIGCYLPFWKQGILTSGRSRSFDSYDRSDACDDDVRSDAEDGKQSDWRGMCVFFFYGIVDEFEV
jgi:hypothetical protein